MKNKPKLEDEKLTLQETVIVGYADIGVAGCRALLGVCGETKEMEFFVEGISPLACCSTDECDRKGNPLVLKPFILCNCNYMLYSFIILNSQVPAKQSHKMAKHLTDWFIKSFVTRVFVVAALRLDITDGPIKRMYENCWNGMKAVTSCPKLPPETVVSDAFLSNLTQLLLIEGIAFTCFSCPCNKAEPAKPNDIDGTLDVIETIQEYLNDFTLLGFSLNKSKNIMYHGNQSDNAASMIYV